MQQIPSIRDEDWRSVRKAFQVLTSTVLGESASPTFAGLTLSGLTASRLTASNASKGIISTDIVSWIAGNTNQVVVTDDGDGSVTLSTPQDIHTGASPTFMGLTLSSVGAEGSDVDKFLVDSTGALRYRTGAQVLSDIEGQPLDAGLTSLAGLGYVSDSMIKITAEDTYAIRTMAEVKTDLSLNNVENTALSTWVGVNTIVTVGTIATGMWQATDVGIAYGGTGQSTAQTAIDALTAVSGGGNEHVLTKDTGTGNAIWKAAAGGADEKVKIDAAATAGYLGAASNDGVLRAGNSLSYTDGGNFVTLDVKDIGAAVRHNANQTIANATDTALAFNTELWDTDTCHDNATNNSRLTCKTAGKYIITVGFYFAINATGFRQGSIKLNNTTTITAYGFDAMTGSIPSYVNFSTLYDLAVNDYIEVFAYQNSGGNLIVHSAANYSPEFRMQRIA